MRVERFIKALLDLDRVAAKDVLAKALNESGAEEAITRLVVPALERIGDAWVAGRVSLSDVYMSSRICEELVKSSTPSAASPRKNQPIVAIAALLDYHLLGKKLVQLALRASGYQALDFGQGISVEALTARVREEHVEVLLVSTLMLPSALKVKELRYALDEAGLHPKIVVGGAPFRFDAQLWKEVGADAMGTSASDALKILDAIVEERTRAA